MSPQQARFALAPLKPCAWQAVAALVLVLIGFGVLGRGDGTLHRAVATTVMIALVALPLALALQRRRITLDGNTLTLAGAIYTRRIAIDQLVLHAARIVDLDEHVELKPVLGLSRFALPGFRAGHYLLRNRQRAFCLLTASERVLILPTRDGKWLLLSPERPQDLLQRLRELAADATRR